MYIRKAREIIGRQNISVVKAAQISVALVFGSELPVTGGVKEKVS